jgi:hypothetical protein
LDLNRKSFPSKEFFEPKNDETDFLCYEAFEEVFGSIFGSLPSKESIEPKNEELELFCEETSQEVFGFTQIVIF